MSGKENKVEKTEEQYKSAFAKFWLWKNDAGITDYEDDWRPWWDCFLKGYLSALGITESP